jgi:hypothetical protein
MTANKKIAAIKERINKLESAHASLSEQVARASESADNEKWREALDSVQEEISSVRRDLLIAQKPGSEKKRFLEKLLEAVEDAEKLVFRTFVLGSTIVGATTLLSHEIAPLQNLMATAEQSVPTQRQEATESSAKRALSVGSGAEPIPESLRRQQEEVHAAYFNPRYSKINSHSNQELGTAVGLRKDVSSLPLMVMKWCTPEKISEPNSIKNFLDVVRNGPTGSNTQNAVKGRGPA